MAIPLIGLVVFSSARKIMFGPLLDLFILEADKKEKYFVFIHGDTVNY